MRERAARRLLLLATALALVVPASSRDFEPLALEQRVIELHRSLSPAVVRVVILSDEPSGNGVPTKWAFSGFFINRAGRVLTNIGGGGPVSRVWVEKDGLSYLAELVGSDSRTNLALLQVVKLPEKFEVIPIPESDEPMPIGSMILGVTSPLELDPSPALGLISGYESFFTSFVFPFTYVRVNLPAGPGEGGSPVVDMQGRLVGISVASVPEVRSSYLVPSRALARIVGDLAAEGRVSYGTLPIEFAERPDPSNVVRQVVVSSVVPDSSAARADVRAGDIVRRLGSSTVRRIHDVRDALFYSRAGQFITLEVEREGRRIPFALPVELRPEPAAGPPVPDRPPAPAEKPASAPAPAPAPVLAPPTRPSSSG